MRAVMSVFLIVAACGSGGGLSEGPPIDGATVITLHCPVCASDELCVVSYDGVCDPGDVECVKIVDGCAASTCTDACGAAYCGLPTVCSTEPERGPTCGGDLPAGAFGCYGP